MIKTKQNKIIKLPADVITVRDHCERGGMEGICVFEKQLVKLSKILGTEYIDEVIPLTNAEQIHPDSCPNDHKSINNVEYWESSTGSHGWCCSICGCVTQWG